MKMEFDIAKMVEEIIMRVEEKEEEFIFETIRPYCENVLQIKINKEELKQLLLNGAQKQQTSDDAISREYVIALLENKKRTRKEITNRIYEAPPIALSKWIPVSERLPEKLKEVIVTDIETSDTYTSFYIGNGYWECDNGTFKNRIIAWMPFPEKYEEVGNE